jgi:methionyl aminopeptidase
MSQVDLQSERYDRHREAGEILTQVRAEAVNRIEVGANHRELVEHVGIDEEAAHATPGADDESTFGEELINIDIGVHVDGWVADSAVTVDLSGNDELVAATDAALEAAIETVGPGVDTGLVGDVIGRTIEGYGYSPVVNLTGHGLEQYEQHAGPTIPNRKVPEGVELSVGDVVAIEPFATDGRGKVSEGSDEEIFALEHEGSVRDRSARQALGQIAEQFQTLPFATRWLEVDRPAMALRRLKQRDLVHSYPVLKERPGALVSQKEHSVIITEDGCEVFTR